MSEPLINLVLQIVAGAVCGNGAGTALKDYNLGTLGNTIAGAIGGVGGGQLLGALIPALVGRRWGRSWLRGRRAGRRRCGRGGAHRHRRPREKHDGGQSRELSSGRRDAGVEACFGQDPACPGRVGALNHQPPSRARRARAGQDLNTKAE
jgi:uncharacterized membrane protein YeaQ/YmgE (transglycosylase-associated protein family)